MHPSTFFLKQRYSTVALHGSSTLGSGHVLFYFGLVVLMPVKGLRPDPSGLTTWQMI
jgi:hypothetical protein